MDGDSIRVATGIGALAVVAIAIGGYVSALPDAKPYVSGSQRARLALQPPLKAPQKKALARIDEAPIVSSGSAPQANAAPLGLSAEDEASAEGEDLVALLEQARAVVAKTSAQAASRTAETDLTADAGTPATERVDAGRPPRKAVEEREPEQASKNGGPQLPPAGATNVDAGDAPSPEAIPREEEILDGPELVASAESSDPDDLATPSATDTEVKLLPLGVGDPFAGVRNVPTYRPSRSARRSGAFSLVGRRARPVHFARWTQGDRPPISVQGSRGKVLVMYAFQGWCPGCQKRGFPVTRALERIYAERPDVEFVYVQSPFEGHFTNDFDRAKRERFNWHIQRPVAQDSVNENGRPSLMQAYRTAGTPWHVIIDKGGIVRFNDFTRNTQGFRRLIDSLL